MKTLKAAVIWTRAHAWLLALAALPLIIAACNGGNTTGGNGY